MIDVAEDIHPLSDFKRRTTEFVRRLHASGRPMLLTLNGRPEVVVLDARSYQKLMNQLFQYETELRPPERKERPRSMRADGVAQRRRA